MAVGDASVVAGVGGRRIGVRASAGNPTSGPGAPRRPGRNEARRHRHTSLVNRVGVDPISDPDTAIMEMLLTVLGRPNFTGQDRQTYCAHCNFGYTELRRHGRSR